jgi:hypothetical protein
MHEVEATLSTVTLTEQQAERLRGAIEASTARPTARSRLEQAVLMLHIVGPAEIRMLQGLIREALAEQAAAALTSIQGVPLHEDYLVDAGDVLRALRQALCADQG